MRHRRRAIWTASAIMALSSPVMADECRILWFDLFLAPSEVSLEQTSDLDASLTMTNTAQPEPLVIELSREQLTQGNGARTFMLLGDKTIVSTGLANEVTVSLQPKTNSWLVSFQSAQTMTAQDGQSFKGMTVLGGHLICDQLKPWALTD